MNRIKFVQLEDRIRDLSASVSLCIRDIDKNGLNIEARKGDYVGTMKVNIAVLIKRLAELDKTI